MPIPTDHSKPIRLSAKENAYNQLQQWIIDGTLLPGEKLNDTELAKALGVSRTPIRESLQLLESQGFVKMYPGKATQVTEVEKDSIKDLLPPLAVLQALSAELAIPHLTEEILEQLRKTNNHFSEAIKTENYYSALKIDEHFHKIIVSAASNPYIEGVLESLQAHVRRQYFHNSIVLTEKSVEEHWEIINLMEIGDIHALTTVMKENWLRNTNKF
ncbi:GntR family transcriptional regulator [Oceanobacillus saliphilus]|uniref:GntR family transcriptional regulator n=1 Tax=Oceanobacillus saliphilus TaxID=2925834 RepID=UPI00201D633A|nr:GntR family transcriptional regulator [Oceanobacillus saliphilus]